jgi:hypothetical protein
VFWCFDWIPQRSQVKYSTDYYFLALKDVFVDRVPYFVCSRTLDKCIKIPKLKGCP